MTTTPQTSEIFIPAPEPANPRALAIAWREEDEPQPDGSTLRIACPDRNLYWTWVSSPNHLAAASVCPVVACGGRSGYVLSEAQAAGFLADASVSAAVKARIWHYLAHNFALSGAIEIDAWLDRRPEWL